MEITKAIVLLAGKGTRLLPLTEERHKALFPVVGRPVIDIIIRNLSKAAIGRIGVNLHHLGRQVTDHMEKNYSSDIEIFYSHEDEILNTGGGLQKLRPFIGNEENFIVHNCDILTNLDLGHACTCHVDTGALVTMVLVDNPPANTVLVDNGGRVLDIAGKFGIKSTESTKLYYGAGIFIYNKRIFDFFPTDVSVFSIIPIIRAVMAEYPESVRAYTAPRTAYWKDMGSIPSYLDAHRDILTRGIVDFSEQNRAGSRIRIGENSKIGDNVDFRGFVSIGDNVETGDNCILEDCVIWDGVRIESDSRLVNAVVTRENLAMESVDCPY